MKPLGDEAVVAFAIPTIFADFLAAVVAAADADDIDAVVRQDVVHLCEVCEHRGVAAEMANCVDEIVGEREALPGEVGGEILHIGHRQADARIATASREVDHRLALVETGASHGFGIPEAQEPAAAAGGLKYGIWRRCSQPAAGDSFDGPDLILCARRMKYVVDEGTCVMCVLAVLIAGGHEVTRFWTVRIWAAL